MSIQERNPKKLSESEKKDILKELEDKHSEMRFAQREIRRRWIKTQGAVQGRQWFTEGAGNVYGVLGLGWEEAGMSSATGDVDEEFMIVNDLRRVYNTDMQRLTSYYLRTDVIPENKSDDMKMGARLGRMFLSDHIRRLGPEIMKAKIARSLILRNIVILKAHFDPHAGRLVKKPKKFLGIFKLGNEWVREGEMVWDFPNPKCVLLPKFCTRPEDADEIEEYHIETVESIFRKFGIVVDGETVDPDYFDGLDDQLRSRDTEGGASQINVKNRVILKEKVVMPCPQYPRGAVFTWCKTTLIRSDVLEDGNPYFSAQLVFNEEAAYVDSVLWDLLPVQGYLNQAMTATHRWLKMISLLRRWIPSGTNVKPDDLDNATGMNSVFDGPHAPEWEEVPELNESIFKTIELARDFMASHGYSNELAKQRRAMSGNALGILQEMDDTIFRPALEQVQSMLTRASMHTLEVASRKISTPRLIKMSSMQGWQIEEGFRGEMLKGNFHADINLMAGMPTNKVLRLEYLKSLYKDGLLPKEQVQAYLEFPSDNDALESMQKQYEIADRRVQDLLKFPDNYEQKPNGQGGMDWVCKIHYNEFDNQALIMAKLQEAMQESFEHWNPWMQMAFLEHWNYAKEQKQKQDMEAAQQQMALQNPPPHMGGGGPPGGLGMPPTPPPPGADPSQGLGGSLGSMMGPAEGGDQPPRDQIPNPMATGFTG